MDDKKDFLWVQFYRELAEKLLSFRNDRNSLIKIIKDIFTKIEIPLPTLDRDNQVTDIDPFTKTKTPVSKKRSCSIIFSGTTTLLQKSKPSMLVQVRDFLIRKKYGTAPVV